MNWPKSTRPLNPNLSFSIVYQRNYRRANVNAVRFSGPKHPPIIQAGRYARRSVIPALTSLVGKPGLTYLTSSTVKCPPQQRDRRADDTTIRRNYFDQRPSRGFAGYWNSTVCFNFQNPPSILNRVLYVGYPAVYGVTGFITGVTHHKKLPP